MFKVLHRAIDANKEPLFFRVCSMSLVSTSCFHCVSYDGSIGETAEILLHCVSADMGFLWEWGYSAA